jgi:hypothetical protein
LVCRLHLLMAMNSYDYSSSVDGTTGIRQEIDALKQQLDDALKTATFVGMTADEAKTYDARRQRLTSLVEQLREMMPCKEEPEPIA